MILQLILFCFVYIFDLLAAHNDKNIDNQSSFGNAPSIYIFSSIQIRKVFLFIKHHEISNLWCQSYGLWWRIYVISLSWF